MTQRVPKNICPGKDCADSVVPNPKDPSILNSMALEAAVFYYRHSFLLSVPFPFPSALVGDSLRQSSLNGEVFSLISEEPRTSSLVSEEAAPKLH